MNKSSEPIHLAIDLGASSGRVLAGSLGDNGIRLEEIHRFPNGGIQQANRLVWNLLGQWQQVVEGLSLAASRYGSSIRSVGADTWGVDYILLDRNDDQLGPCFNYRDPRTRGILERAFERMPRTELFAATGLQFIEINSLYQLLAMQLEDSPMLDIAERFLMVPDYVHWQLSGEKINEYTNASTTQLLDPVSGSWSHRVLEAFQLPERLFSEPEKPGSSLGNLTPSVVNQTNLSPNVEVIVPATHDTGSAVLAIPAASFAPPQPDWCYISCGTWSLIGAELASPNLSDACLRYNFTNEGGVQNSVRLLKNVCGLWVVEQCRAHWKREGKDWSWNRLIEMAEAAPSLVSVIDPDDAQFIAPDDMPNAIRQFCAGTFQPIPNTEGEVIRCALESLALKYRIVLGHLEELVGGPFSTVHMVGGGVQNRLLCQFTADACRKAVVAGPVEATAMGNLTMQAIGTGQLGSIEEARQLIRKSADIAHYSPHDSGRFEAPGRWEDAVQKLQSLTPKSQTD